MNFKPGEIYCCNNKNLLFIIGILHQGIYSITFVNKESKSTAIYGPWTIQNLINFVDKGVWKKI